ncbi:CocE/NonD family hydrolase [Halomonas campisalis]|uniref:CocE/NonD family hydrolase n=1 Tax=Billgrantia campisalis TaxID=74661 RepID=A0ABS9P8N4_9GAMM|nr:CocE/NonD family hydrolase [Halomonas campisalis]MCG6657577.1 CocE/NonD family hydrolase [Halomonas campisalis]MDR5862649.1 CocE/NonD family hydrolase [Halomonas campisalis]
METVHDFPYQVRRIENLWIPLPEGTRLAARAWIPEAAETTPVPAILEYIPYRKRDFTRSRDDIMHGWFAGHGYACLRVDLRGSGESEGLLTDEYLPQELDDGEAVLRWIADQPWCNGRVGMIGISWGGFNGLQLAARQPPELGAVIAVCATDDRYTDDIHYMGGCLLADNLSWASTMYSHTALPPDPALVGESWRETWHKRMAGSGFWLESWLSHQRRDDYWRHGSVNEHFDAVQVPVMAVSGWADGYSNAVLRLLEGLRVPRQGLIGPWGHKYPHQGQPGPAIDFLSEAVRWWDRWLKGVESGVEAEPMLRAWMQESARPETNLRTRPGRWVGEPAWPSPRIRDWVHPLSRGRVGGPGHEADSGRLSIQSPLSVGLFAGRWCSFTATPDLPHDQREEDGGSLVFDSKPLEAPLEILGAPVVRLRVAADQPVAMVAVRLSDVAENDEATRVSYGVLNLAHRNGHADPQPLTPGDFHDVRVELNDIGQRFPAGHRIRVSVSTSYWPVVWPAPVPTRLTVDTAGSTLSLPVRDDTRGDDALRDPGPARGAPAGAVTQRIPRDYAWNVLRDLAADRSVLEVRKDEGESYLAGPDLTLRIRTVERYSHTGNDYRSVRGETEGQRTLSRGDWSVTVRTRTVLTSDATHFYLRAEMDGYEGDRRVHSHNIERAIERDGV